MSFAYELIIAEVADFVKLIEHLGKYVLSCFERVLSDRLSLFSLQP